MQLDLVDGRPDARARVEAQLAELLGREAVSYTHLRAHETSLHLVCRLLLEKSGRVGELCARGVGAGGPWGCG